jgi:hypothetical protein
MHTKITKSLRIKSFLALLITEVTLLASSTSYAEDTKPCYCSCLLVTNDQDKCKSLQYNESKAKTKDTCHQECVDYFNDDKIVGSFCSKK